MGRIQEAATKKIKAYQTDLIESLRDARKVEEYLNAALEEDDLELFLLAVRNVAKAQGGWMGLGIPCQYFPEHGAPLLPLSFSLANPLFTPYLGLEFALLT